MSSTTGGATIGKDKGVAGRENKLISSPVLLLISLRAAIGIVVVISHYKHGSVTSANNIANNIRVTAVSETVPNLDCNNVGGFIGGPDLLLNSAATLNRSRVEDHLAAGDRAGIS